MRSIVGSTKGRVALAAAALLVLGACTFTVTPTAALGDPITATATFTDDELDGWALGSVLFEAFAPGDPTCEGIPVHADEQYVTSAGTYTSTFTPAAAGLYHWQIIYFHFPFADFGPNGIFGYVASCADATSLVTGGTDLVASKSGPSVVTAGVPFAYTVSVKNNGPASATGVALTDTLPAGLVTLVSAPGCSGTTTVVCPVGTLASGATSATFTITVTPNVTNPFGTSLVNTVVATPTAGDPNVVNNTATATSTQSGCTTSGQGTSGNDVICAGQRAVQGRGGDDVIYGANTGVQIQGGDGNDVIFGGGGNDQLSGDNGNDRIYGGGGNDAIQGGNGTDYADGGVGTDTCNAETKVSCP